MPSEVVTVSRQASMRPAQKAPENNAAAREREQALPQLQ